MKEKKVRNKVKECGLSVLEGKLRRVLRECKEVKENERKRVPVSRYIRLRGKYSIIKVYLRLKDIEKENPFNVIIQKEREKEKYYELKSINEVLDLYRSLREYELEKEGLLVRY